MWANGDKWMLWLCNALCCNFTYFILTCVLFSLYFRPPSFGCVLLCLILVFIKRCKVSRSISQNSWKKNFHLPCCELTVNYLRSIKVAASEARISAILLLLWRILNGRGLPNCLTELPSLKCLSSSLHGRDSHPFANVLRHLLLGLPLPLLPSHVPSKNSFSNVLYRLMWPKYDNFCFLIRFKSCGAFWYYCQKIQRTTTSFHIQIPYLSLGGLNCMSSSSWHH